MKGPADNSKNNIIGEIIRSRRTTNFFQNKRVPVSQLMKAIDVARWAPNHRLTEPWHFYILGKKTRLKLIELITDIKSAGKSESMRIATRKRLDDIPGWFVLTSDLSSNPVIRQENYAACCCAAQNLMLFLWSEGIGVKWTTGEVTRDNRFYKLLKIDKEQRKVVGLFWYGYPAYSTSQTRRSAREIATKLD